MSDDARHNRSSRLILVATIVGSGAVFLEGSVTTVALPAIARDFGLGLAGLQWVMNGYLLTLSALILLGGALGDRYSRRRVFAAGLAAFAIASLGCALAPNLTVLVIARLVQGAAGAMAVPNSLALLENTFQGEARGAAIGQWSAWSAVSTALGPLIGGSLVDATSWRIVFVCVAPFALIAAAITTTAGRGEKDAPREQDAIDYAGAATATLGLAAVVGALIAGQTYGYTNPIVDAAFLAGLALLWALAVIEHRAKAPLLPLRVFRSREFVGVNLTTLFVYAALTGLFFLLMLQLQTGLHYSALAAGSSLLPINALMLLISPLSGRLAHRVGPRLPMVVGALVAGAGMLLFARVQSGAPYALTVLPAAVVFGVGLALFVAPLTTVALSALGEHAAGLASGVNNAVARLAGLLSTAILPIAAGLGGAATIGGPQLAAAFVRAMMISAGLCAAGALVAAFTIKSATTTREDPAAS